MSYRVKEVFATIQGEGRNAGTAAVFVRFAGCNLWNGQHEDRARDAERNEAKCPNWCDTDFVGGDTNSAEELAARVSAAAELAGMGTPPLIVFTGGEPLLQLDVALLERFPDSQLAIETNGTVEPTGELIDVVELLDWICVSPKVEPDRIRLRHGNEIKVVFPAYDPLAYESLAAGFAHWYVSPLATPLARPGLSLLDQDAMQAAAEFVRRHPRWRLSVQAHKLVGIP